MRSHIYFKHLQNGLYFLSVGYFWLANLINANFIGNAIRFLDSFELLLRHYDYFAILEQFTHLSNDLHLPIVRVAIEQNYWHALNLIASHSLFGLKLQSKDGFVDLIPKRFLTYISYFNQLITIFRQVCSILILLCRDYHFSLQSCKIGHI